MKKNPLKTILFLLIGFLILANISPAGASTGSINIVSDPTEADVYINEIYKGKTPLVIDNLESGIVYTITTKKAGYRDASTRIQDIKGQNQKINMRMMKDIAVIKIESNPSNANVFLDGVHKGKTPMTLELPIETYTIKVWKDKYEPQSKTLRMDQRSYLKPTELNFTLESTGEFPDEDANLRQIPGLNAFILLTLIAIAGLETRKKSL
jgi:hypothetical protein